MLKVANLARERFFSICIPPPKKESAIFQTKWSHDQLAFVAHSLPMLSIIAFDKKEKKLKKAFKNFTIQFSRNGKGYLLESDAEYRDAEYRGIIAVRG